MVILNVIITDEEYRTSIRLASNEMDVTEKEKDMSEFLKKVLNVNLKENNFNNEKKKK